MEPIDFSAQPLELSRDEAINGALEAIAANDLDRGIELTQRLNTLEPNSNIALHLVGLLSLRLGEPGKAVSAFEAAHHQAPDVREHIEALAIVFSKSGRLVDSLFYGKLATAAAKDTGFPALLPDWLGSFDQAFYNMNERPLLKQARALYEAGHFEAASEAFRREIELDPTSIDGWRGLAQALYHAGQYDDALVAGEALVSVSDQRAEDLSIHGLILAAAGRFDEAMVAGREAESLAPEDATIAWRTVQAQGRKPDRDPANLAALAERWGRRFVADQDRPRPADPAEFIQRRVRIGVISSHWAHGDGLDTFVPIFELLDRRRVELVVYADGLIASPLANRLRARSNLWQELTDLDGETAAFLVRNDALDILIDLDDPLKSTHADLIARAPAPHVLALYGDLDVALAAGFTGVLAEAPRAGGRQTGRQDRRLVAIDGGLIAQPSYLVPLEPDQLSMIGPTPTFGTLAEGWQIGAVTIAAWHRILSALPTATLLLNASRLGGRVSAVRLAAQLPDGRFSFAETGSINDYLAAVDILLDPIGNPISDPLIAAIAQGMPGITCRSRSARANMAAGWLDRVGLAALVADDAADYERKAIAAATTPIPPDEFAAALIEDRTTAAERQAARLVDAIARLVSIAPAP